MKVSYSGKDFKVGEHLQNRIIEKLSRFDRYFGEDAVAHVTVRAEGEMKRIDVTIKVQRHLYRAECEAEDVFSAMDLAVEVIEGQIRKNKTRFEKRIHDYAYMKEFLKSTPDEVEVAEGRIIRRKSFELQPMDAEEAVLQMEMLGHSFLLFHDQETDKVCVVYKRKDGNYGLIVPA
jgi:putative sigma-54 modulation protein